MIKQVLISLADLLNIHNWEYWTVKVHYETACGKHKRMNHTVTTPNRKCKWTGKKQHKLHTYEPRRMYNEWRPGNRKHNQVIKIYADGVCNECFDLLHGYDNKSK